MDKIPASSVTAEADIFFVDQAAALFPCNLAFAVLSGSDAEINAVINYPHSHGLDPIIVPPHDWISSYRGPLRAIVAVACKEYADKMAATPLNLMDRLYARRGMNRQVRFPKLYAQYFGA